MARVITILKFGEILNERPEGMSYAKYRAERKDQQRRLRGYDRLNGNIKEHIFGRLEGALIPSYKWTNAKDVQIVIE